MFSPRYQLTDQDRGAAAIVASDRPLCKLSGKGEDMGRDLIVLLLALAAPASKTALPAAEFYAYVNGNMLWGWCSSPSGAPACSSYVLGVYDSWMYARGGRCLPPGVQAQQLEDVVKTYLRENPQVRQNAAAVLVRGAIQGAFPHCA